MLVVAACSSDTCRDSTNAVPVAAFYSSSTQGMITVDSLTVYGIGVPNDSATLTVNYVPQLVFTSAECGVMYFYEIPECGTTTHLIDSVAVVSADVSNVSAETLRIYFRTSDDGGDDNSGETEEQQ